MTETAPFDSAFFEDLFENSTTIAAITDADGVLLRVNRRSVELFFGTQHGFEGVSVIGRNILEFIHKDDRPKVLERWERSLKDHREVNYDLRMCSPDGRVMYFLITGRPIVKDGQVVMFHYEALNMLDQKVHEKNLMASAGADVIAQIAGGFAHDFNNLLTVINGYAQMMKMSIDDLSPLAHKINQIFEAGRKASELTQRMLDFSKRGRTRESLIDVASEISNQEAIIRHILGDRVGVTISRSPDLGGIMMDPSRLSTILVNLAANAKDAMPGGGDLTISAEPFHAETQTMLGPNQVQAGRYVRLSVKDTGHGMDDQVLARIFEPFFSTRENGKGIGLWTVKNIVQNSGGVIHVESMPGRGTTVTMLMPLAAQAPVPTATAEEPKGARAETSGNGLGTVLIVEDEDPVRDLVSEVLSRQGYHTITARNGGDALQMARQYGGSIDLLITDMVMRRIDGRMLAKKMRSMWPDIRIMFMSGYGREILQGDDPGEAAFLPKPFLPEDLVEKVQSVMRA
jgi:PAS domain S-box-containing protein